MPTNLEAFLEAKQRIVFIVTWENSGYGRALYNKYKDKFINDVKAYKLFLNVTRFQVIFSLSTKQSAGVTNSSVVKTIGFFKPDDAFYRSFNRTSMKEKVVIFSVQRA